MFQKRFVVKVMATAFLLTVLLFSVLGVAYALSDSAGVSKSVNPELYNTLKLANNYSNFTPGRATMTVICKMTKADKVNTSRNSLITAPALTPSASSGYTPYEGNRLKITANVTSLPYWPVNVYAAIYTSSGKWIANTTVLKNQRSGSKTFYWDGKVASGNGLGLPAGQFLNKNGGVTDCKVRIVAVQSSNTNNVWNSGFVSFKVYPMPVVRSVMLAPSSTAGFAVGYPNTLKISASVTVPVQSLVVAVIYDRNGKYVAKTSALTNQSSGVKTFYWDGKVSSGNQISLPAGSYAPNSSTGVLYKVKMAATNASMGVNAQYSSPADINLFSKITISGVTVSPTAFTAGASSGNTVKIGYKLSRMSNVSVWVYNSNYSKIYAKVNYSYVNSGAVRYASWDGKATVGNTAGMQAGVLVPAGSYKVKVFAAGTCYAPSTAITVNRIVPNLVGKTKEQAQNDLTNIGLNAAFVEEWSDSVPVNNVIKQSVAAGTLVKPGMTITITVSKGVQPVTVPNLIGKSKEQAQNDLTNIGLIAAFVEEWSDTVPVNNVINQSIAAGTLVTPGTTITITVSKGVQYVTVPNLIGMSKDDAIATILADGLTVGIEYHRYKWDVAVNYVFEQSQTIGAPVPIRSSINIVFSDGPKPFAVGDDVYYNGGTYYAASDGTGNHYSCSPRIVTILYIHSGKYPYCIEIPSTVLGWVNSSEIEQRTD